MAFVTSALSTRTTANFSSNATNTRRPRALAISSSSFTGSPVAVCVEEAANTTSARPAKGNWSMGKVAKFGPFTPAVVAARLVLGEKTLNKLRGKGISLHSQAITNFCEYTGTGRKMRQTLIRRAKENGNTLGFLS